MAAIAHSFHYARRVLEVLFLHKFSRATLAVRLIPRYCVFYGVFSAWMSYLINHPLYTPPPDLLIYIGAVFFIIAELGSVRTGTTFSTYQIRSSK